MKISLVSAGAAELNVDALAIPVATGQQLADSAAQLDRAMGGVLAEMVVNAEFRGRIHEVLPIPAQGKIGPRRVILYGLGAVHDLDGQRVRSAHHELVRASLLGRKARTWQEAARANVAAYQAICRAPFPEPAVEILLAALAGIEP